MPIYEYECDKCEARFEGLVPYAHRDEVACEACGEAKAQRLASVFASSSVDGMSSAPAMPTGMCCMGSCSCCGD
jgi:putative FmdB family regulatory protein